ncbi:MAG: hypothetical protein JWQ96_1140 [Segetibacter sp.]|nr:hypothetical protein [Segetibacter sp.]
MKYIFTTLSFFFSYFLHAQDVNLVWAKNMGSTTADNGLSVAVDASGNVFTTGYFTGTTDFDPGAGTTNLTSSGEGDGFISKLNASGNFVWAIRFGSNEDDRGQSITVDASGNVYLTGYFSGTVDFDPGAGVTNLSTSSGYEIFVLKLDGAGNLTWAKKMGDDFGYDYGRGIAVDGSGNVYTTGQFNGPEADFNPGAATFNLASNNGSDDVFVSKLDATGNFVWAVAFGSPDFDRGTSIGVDASGNVYTTGFFSTTADFDPGAGTSNLTSAGSSDVFISKLSSAGTFVWARRMGGTGGDVSNDLALDASGNVHTTGYFLGTVDFDPNAGTANLTAAGNADIFVSKLDAAGNYVWAKNLGGTSFDNGNSIALDGSGNVYTTGGFSGTADFDPGAGTTSLTSAGSADIFISKLTAAGNFVTAVRMGGTSSEGGNQIIVDASSNIYITGDLQGTADFDPNAGVVNVTSNGEIDIHVAKFSQSSALPVFLTSLKAYEKNLGVQIDWVSQQEYNTHSYEVERSKSAQQFFILGTVQAKGNTSVTNYTLSDRNPFAGVNFYRLKIIDRGGSETYSTVLKVHVGNVARQITVYPNPVQGNRIVLQLNKLEKGDYHITLTDKLGRQLMSKMIRHLGGSATETIEPAKALAPGVYQLLIKGDDVNIIKQVIKN